MRIERMAKAKSVLAIPALRLPKPAILFTIDSDQPGFETDTLPVLDLFALHGIPVTLFLCNRDGDGDENDERIAGIVDHASRRGQRLEIGSHSVDHSSLSDTAADEAAEIIKQSLRLFSQNGITATGFRAPYLSTEQNYRETLGAVRDKECPLKYDSSVCFESNFMGTFFHLLTARKCPHQIAGFWELPISCLDDYHLLERMRMQERLVHFYWNCQIRFWVWRLNYCLVLLHPHIMSQRRELLASLLSDCRRRFPAAAFKTCSDLVGELDLHYG